MVEKCHFIGIGGIGMSGLARLMLAKKIPVSGSDLSNNYLTEGLSEAGAKVFLGHSASYIDSATTVVYSTDIQNDNPEYQAAVQLNCPILHRSDLLVALMEGYKTLLVTGTHGKTTTSALLASLLNDAELHPCYAVGGVIPQFKTNAGYGKGEYFIAEADESDGTFLKYAAYGAIVTNIDLDHMNYFKTEAALIASFKIFLDRVKNPEFLFWCGEDNRLRQLNCKGISYGFTDDCQLKGSNFSQEGWKVIFDVDFQGQHYSKVELELGGYHNALNGLAIFGLGLKLGIKESAIRQAFKNFKGILRRSEKKGEVQGIQFFDDYGHHPTEIQATLKSFRNAVQEKRLVVVYQPHRYSRTKDCLGKFTETFKEADLIIITDIYGAGEAPIPGLQSLQIVEEVRKSTKSPVIYASRQDLVKELAASLRPHDVVLTFGAGDITRLSEEILNYFKNFPPKKMKVGVVFGGRSTEHEISLTSTRNILQGLNPEFYDVQHFGISKEGNWCYGTGAMQKLEKGYSSDQIFPEEVSKEFCSCDIFIPVLHGPYGEDGTIQGFFEMLDKAYIGCDHRSSAICMDKALTKKLVFMEGISVVPFVRVSLHEWRNKQKTVLSQVKKNLRYPVFVKPLHLGSAVGVAKASSETELIQAAEDALNLDTDFLIENGLNIREIEFSVLGNDTVKTFPPGEIFTSGEVYTYDAKYGSKAMKAAPKTNLSEGKISEGMNLARQAYSAVGCCGMARVDFFLDENEQYWMNEINPFPGFTQNSLYPLICIQNGLSLSDLMDQLIILGLQRKRRQCQIAMVN